MKLITATVILYIVGTLLFWWFRDFFYATQAGCSAYYVWQKTTSLLFLLIVNRAVNKLHNFKNKYIVGIIQVALAIAIDRIVFEIADAFGFEPENGWQQMVRFHSIAIFIIFMCVFVFSLKAREKK